MNKLLFFHEIFNKIQECETEEERIAILRENRTEHMEILVQMSYNDAIVMELPPTTPPYTPNIHYELNSLKQVKRLINCLESNRRVGTIKKQTHYIQLLDALPHEDAEIIEAGKNKRLHEYYDSLTKELFQNAYPDLAL